MNEPMTNQPTTAERFYEYMTQTTWLHVEDALAIGRLRLFAGRYRRGQGSEVTMAHWLSVEEARVLFHDMAEERPLEFIEYKGSARGEEVVSRVLRVNTGRDEKVYVELSRGRGRLSETGAVMPAARATTQVTVPLSAREARKLAYAVLERLQARAVAALLDRPGKAAGDDQRLPPAAAPAPATAPTTGQPARVPAINEELFGPEENPTPQRARRPANGAHRGRLGTAVGGRTAPPPAQVGESYLYANGDTVQPERVADFQVFLRTHRVAPWSEEKLVSWVYRG